MFIVRRISVAFAVIGLGFLLGCGDARVRDVDNSVNFA
jgi:hypothetical protein